MAVPVASAPTDFVGRHNLPSSSSLHDDAILFPETITSVRLYANSSHLRSLLRLAPESLSSNLTGIASTLTATVSAPPALPFFIYDNT